MKRAKADKPTLPKGFVTDDATGLPTSPPGIEASRELVNQMHGWEGEGLPAPAELQPMPNPSTAIH